MQLENLIIRVAARSSPLSQVQVKEVLDEIRYYCPEIAFETTFMDTKGDKDLITSLRKIGKTDFFTWELDDSLLNDHCRIAIHSAKDLPDPLPQGLSVIALTQGLNSSDVIVLKENVCFENLPPGSIIATSSIRREEIVRSLRADLQFRDLRGTIHQRLKLIEEGEVAGVVVAEAALIRLGLTHLNRIFLPGESTPLQGRLAIVAREHDYEMKQLFSYLHKV